MLCCSDYTHAVFVSKCLMPLWFSSIVAIAKGLLGRIMDKPCQSETRISCVQFSYNYTSTLEADIVLMS